MDLKKKLISLLLAALTALSLVLPAAAAPVGFSAGRTAGWLPVFTDCKSTAACRYPRSSSRTSGAAQRRASLKLLFWPKAGSQTANAAVL